jgi:hypothetical protein
MNRHYGFVLAEFIMVVLIFSMIMGGIFGILTVGRQSWHTGSIQVELQQQARRAMDWMVREIRQSGLDYAPEHPGEVIGLADDGLVHNTITFRMSQGWDNINDWIDWGNQIQYSVGGLNNQQLLRSEGPQTTVLANNVVGLEFRRQPGSPIVELSLQAQKVSAPGRTLQRTLNSQVVLRN